MDVLVKRVTRALTAAANEVPTVVDADLAGPAERIDRDRCLLEASVAGRLALPLLRIWTNDTCLVATARHGARAEFQKAASASEERGWPIALRRSGGAVVAHAPGILNVSLFHATDRSTIVAGYAPLTVVLRNAFLQLGLAATVGRVDDAFCAGACDLAIDGAKVAGLAAAARIRGSQAFWLVHASILITAEPEPLLTAIVRFEQDLGLSRAYRAAAHTTIERAFERVPGDPSCQPWCTTSLQPIPT